MSNYTPWPGSDPGRQPYGGAVGGQQDWHQQPGNPQGWGQPSSGPQGWGQPTDGQQNWGQPPSYHGSPQGFPPGSGGPRGQPPKNRKPLFITLGATVAVLVVIGFVVGVLVGKRGNDDATASGGSGTTTSGDASAVVKQYLDALSKGDAEAALALGASEPGSSDLLTDDVLKQQIAKLPITDIQVSGEEKGDDGDHVTVKASARFGDRRSEGKIPMVHDDNGWKLEDAFVNVGTLAKSVSTSPDTVLQIFGKPLDSAGHFYIFPGYMELGTATPFMAVTPPAPIGLDQLSSNFAFIDFKYSMTDAGKKAAEDAVRAWLTKCYSPGPKTGYCDKLVGGPDWADWDNTTIALTGPIDLSVMKYDFNTALRYVMATGNIANIPITIKGKDGQTVPLIATAFVAQQIDLGVSPAVVVETK